MKHVPRHARRKAKRLSPYRRIETELTIARAALSEACAQYSRALQALSDLLEYHHGKRPTGSGWSAEDVKRLREISAIAEGK